MTGPVLSGRSSRTATPSCHATDMKDLRNLASYGERWNTKPDAMAVPFLKLLFLSLTKRDQRVRFGGAEQGKRSSCSSSCAAAP